MKTGLFKEAKRSSCVFEFIVTYLKPRNVSQHLRKGHVSHVRELAWLWYREHK